MAAGVALGSIKPSSWSATKDASIPIALVVTLIMTIVSVLGIGVSRHITFPLAFLLFAVPVGDKDEHGLQFYIGLGPEL